MRSGTDSWPSRPSIYSPPYAIFTKRFLPAISKTALFFSVTLGLAFFITLLAAPSAKASAHMVFVEYYNASGWSDGVAFFIGINVINGSFSCLDAATHLAEEIPHPRVNIPKALVALDILLLLSLLCLRDQEMAYKGSWNWPQKS